MLGSAIQQTCQPSLAGAPACDATLRRPGRQRERESGREGGAGAAQRGPAYACAYARSTLDTTLTRCQGTNCKLRRHFGQEAPVSRSPSPSGALSGLRARDMADEAAQERVTNLKRRSLFLGGGGWFGMDAMGWVARGWECSAFISVRLYRLDVVILINCRDRQD